ncbi:RNA polymerase sigma factor [Nocardioides sp.]|uniref:RNA polymerase sigma factor n=1 Tax=Nocardioides sp. TaxID=35761 RepID=UPI002618B44C|nr:RNA polymerase sigma factor [Nocardioides sp.]
MTSVPGLDEELFRTEYPRVVASLARRFGDLDLAEDGASEALLAAVEHWPAEGVPPNPGGWLTTTATRKVLDRLRRESQRDAKQSAAARLADVEPASPVGPVDDDQLRLIFVCSHPALAPENRLALTLRLVGGLTVPEIARALLAGEAAIGQRITRAKHKIRTARIPFRVPTAEDLEPRLASVLQVLYLIFNEGYLASSGSEPTRVDLATEAIRLTRTLGTLLPDQPEVDGLLALMLLADARRDARFVDGELVTLEEQDRTHWNTEQIAEGHRIVLACIARNRPGPYQLQAAINAVHTSARSVEETDWSQIVTLYDHLRAIAPSPVVELNRAIAVAELDGPAVGLALVEGLALTTYGAWHVTRAELLRRLQRVEEAREAYGQAIGLATNAAERRHLERRRDATV